MVRIFVLAALIATPWAGQAAPLPAPPPQPPPHQSPPHQTPAHPTPAHHGAAKPVPVIRPHTPPHPGSRPGPHPPAAPVQPAAPPEPAPPPAPAEPLKGTNTGLPLPRFASLKTDEVNLRSGPGLRYPIDWVYKRRDLPVQIEREFELWRLIDDFEGFKGWVHQATLVGHRTFVVIGGERLMRDTPAPDASPVARLKPGVIGRIRSCEANADWCQVQVGDYRGWLLRSEFWGSYKQEAIQ